MTNASVTALGVVELYRGSDWRFDMPDTVLIDGSAVDYESVGFLQLQYREVGSTGTPTRWKTTDGAARWDGTGNAWLIPDSDALLTGTGDSYFIYEIHYFDASSNPKLVGKGGSFFVRDVPTGLGV